MYGGGHRGGRFIDLHGRLLNYGTEIKREQLMVIAFCSVTRNYNLHI